MVSRSTAICTYIACGIYKLAIYESNGEWLQPTLCLSSLIKRITRIGENIVIVLLSLHYKVMSKSRQIPDVLAIMGVLFLQPFT
jgi:hypothetical protein